MLSASFCLSDGFGLYILGGLADVFDFVQDGLAYLATIDHLDYLLCFETTVHEVTLRIQAGEKVTPHDDYEQGVARLLDDPLIRTISGLAGSLAVRIGNMDKIVNLDGHGKSPSKELEAGQLSLSAGNRI
jgi:hypothetical protein